MATLFQKFILFLQGKRGKKIELDPETLRKHHILEAQQQKIGQLQAELNAFNIKEAERKERAEQKEEDKNIRFELDEQNKQIIKKNTPKYVSLLTFFKKYIHSKAFRQKLAFYSFDGSKKLGKFKDIGFAENGDLVLIGEGNEILMSNSEIDKIFYNLGSFESDLQAGRIPLCVTPQGKYQENIMMWKPAQLVPIKGKFQYSHASKKYLYDYLSELNEQLGQMQGELEQRDLSLIELKNKNNELQVALNTYKSSAEIANRDMSLAQKEMSEVSNSFRTISNELAKQRDTNVIYSDNLDKLETQLDKMRKEAEREGVKLAWDDAISKIDELKEITRQKTVFIPQNQPQTQHNVQ